MAALFRESLDDEDDPARKKAELPMWSKPSIEAKQSQRHAEELLKQDATVFQYDEVIDDEKREAGIEIPTQQVRTNALEQKKRQGLVIRQGAEAVQIGSDSRQKSKYIEKVMLATDRRRAEQQIVEDRALAKEQNAREGREVFVTQAFKEELKRRKKFEEELEAQELRDKRRDAAKMENGQGFADFHRALLSKGMASARGEEKNKAQNAVREDLPEEEPVKEEVKEEVKDEKEAKEAKTEAKQEEPESKDADHGVQDVAGPAPGTKAAKKMAEQEERAEKAMSAKERYLARKRAAEAPPDTS